jgi:hypothetical protein
MLTHLTEQGVDAGRVLCGAAKTPDNQYLHWVYIDDVYARPQFYKPLCEECKAIAEAAE